ncbi:MAG: S8 family serine peptidase [Pseudomonadota bacterium]
MRPQTYPWVQFVAPPNSQQRRQLAADGVTTLEWLGGTSWRAAVTEQGIERLLDEQNVRWVGLPESRLKAEVAVLSGDVAANQWRAGGRIALQVVFQADVRLAEARAVIEALDGDIDADAARFRADQTASVVLATEQVQLLLDEDLVAWVERASPPVEAFNNRSAERIGVRTLGSAPWELLGNNQLVGVWDVGGIEHPDLSGRVVAGETLEPDSHATAIAGTIAGNGDGSVAATGMAPLARIESYDAPNHLAELRRAALRTDGQSVPLSNHSYGFRLGWYRECGRADFAGSQDLFGAYTADTRAIDTLVRDTRNVVSWAAGNDRDDAGPADAPASRPPDCQRLDSAYEAGCVGPLAGAKNVVAVGAWDTTGAAGFSSAGPTQDGRIKPDVMAPGVRLLTPINEGFEDFDCDGEDDWTTPYRRVSGTSLAAPVVTGTVALLREQASRDRNTWRGSTYKGLLINTASARSPTYQEGWGLINAERALYQLAHPTETCVQEVTLSDEGESTRDIEFNVARQPNLAVTVAWTDPPAAAGASSALVNDVDLVLIDPSGNTWQPWILNPANPATAATRGVDRTNNVEKVSLQNPLPGRWTARIQASRLISRSQTVSLIGTCGDADSDGDSHLIGEDNCPEAYNPRQEDADGDGRGDVCDIDADGDDIDNPLDNCPSIANADQSDIDGDGIGDLCDADQDGDCVPNNRDLCDAVADCGFFSDGASARHCEDPCRGFLGRTEEFGVVTGIGFRACALDPIFPDVCFTTGCPWPEFRTDLGIDPRQALEAAIRELPEELTGARLLPNGNIILPPTATGFLNGQSIDIGRRLRSLQNSLPPPQFALPGDAGTQTISGQSTGGLQSPAAFFGRVCSTIIGGGFFTPDAGSLRRYSQCRREEIARTSMCRVDSDGDGVGDACDSD